MVIDFLRGTLAMEADSLIVSRDARKGLRL
jgi:hypothetical protein